MEWCLVNQAGIPRRWTTTDNGHRPGTWSGTRWYRRVAVCTACPPRVKLILDRRHFHSRPLANGIANCPLDGRTRVRRRGWWGKRLFWWSSNDYFIARAHCSLERIRTFFELKRKYDKAIIGRLGRVLRCRASGISQFRHFYAHSNSIRSRNASIYIHLCACICRMRINLGFSRAQTTFRN